MSEPLLVEEEQQVVLLGLNRPEKRNALSEELVQALHAALDSYARRPSILVVHSATPGIFAAGADIAELLKRRADDAFQGIIAGLCDHLEAHRWPTLAVVDGPALGGGCELAMACDLRVATPRARFGQPEPALGIIAGAGGNWRLPQLVGVGTARRMLYAGETLDGGQALASGLVDWLHDEHAALEAARETARRIATRSWRALELTKLALRLHRPATTTFDLAAQALLFDGQDKRERMERFLRREGR